jgi:isopentenyldiphosphate isomerase
VCTVDYILFITANTSVVPRENEVSDYRFVTKVRNGVRTLSGNGF